MIKLTSVLNDNIAILSHLQDFLLKLFVSKKHILHMLHQRHVCKSLDEGTYSGARETGVQGAKLPTHFLAPYFSILQSLINVQLWLFILQFYSTRYHNELCSHGMHSLRRSPFIGLHFSKSIFWT